MYTTEETGKHTPSGASPDSAGREEVSVASIRSELQLAKDDFSWSEKRYRKIFDQSKDGIIVIDAQQHLILDLNSSMAAMHGYSRDDLLTKNISAIWPDQISLVVSLELSTTAGHPAADINLECYRKDGELIQLVISASLVEFGGSPSILCIVRDETERKRAEHKLAMSEEKYRRLYNETPAMLHSIDQHGKLVSVSNHWLKTLGYNRQEIIGHKSIDFLTEKSREYALNVVLPKYYRDGYCTDIPYKMVKKNGEIVDTLLSATSEKNEKGEIIRSLAIITDVTESKLAEEELKAAQAMLLESQRVGQIGSYTIDIPAGIWGSSDVLNKIFGIDNEFVRSLESWQAIIHPDWQQTMAEYFEQEVIGKQVRFDKDFQILRISDKSMRWVHGNGELSFDDTGNPVRMVGTVQDITERKQGEQILQVLFDISQAAAVTENLETFIDSVRQHLGRVIDTTNFYIALYNEATGGYTFPSYFDQYDDWSGTLRFLPDGPTEFVRRTGKSKIWVEESFNQAYADKEIVLHGTNSKCWLGAPLHTKEGVIGVLALQSYQEAFAYTKHDLQIVDSIVGTVALALERKQAEEKERILNEKLKRSERMESLGLLAGGVAHDLNNALVPLVAIPDLILDILPDDTPVKDDLLQMKKSAESAATIIGDLLTMARRGNYEMVPLCLNDIITEYQNSAGFKKTRDDFRSVKIEFVLAGDLYNVLGSAPHLSKVVMNLIMNAVHSHESSGSVEIRTGNQLVGNKAGVSGNIPMGEYAVFEVSDKGSGIPKEQFGKIFEPFYTTKSMESSKGTGLGLSIVQGVIHDHDAYLDIKSEVGVGTTFSVFFPVTESLIKNANESEFNFVGHETILVIDDIPVQIEMVQQILSTFGYHVHGELGGVRGINYIRDNKVDLVVLDMIMDEDYDGLKTYQEILKINPGQKAIIVSGFSESERVIEANKLGADGFINKPYTVQEMGKVVRTVLDM